MINSSIEFNYIESGWYDYVINNNISIISPFDTSGTDFIFETILFDLELDGSFTYYESEIRL